MSLLTKADLMTACLAHAAEQIRHCGDYGQLLWNAQTKTAFWIMADSDGGDGLSTPEEIRSILGSVPGVDRVEIGDESGPRDGEGGWVLVPYQRSAADAQAMATSAEDIERAGQETHSEPTDAQKAAGNYKKGRITIQGLPVAIEVARGGVRSGTDRSGKPWSITMKDAYGYISTADGADGDKVDCFLGDDPQSDRVFVIDQVDPETREFDEHKVVLGAKTAAEARAIYDRNYQSGWQGFGAMKEMDIAAFKQWLKTDTSKPVAMDREMGFYCATCDFEFDRQEATVPAEMPACPKCGSNNDVALTAGATDGVWQSDLFLVSDPTEWTAVTDRQQLKPGELMRVRQLMSLADAVNENDRLYPFGVFKPSIDAAQPRVRAGVMTMELEHPEVVASRRKRRQQYVDNPDRKTARIDVLEMLPNGQVWATFTVLDLPCGREVADAYLAQMPYGTSMRFVMQWHEAKMDGRTIDVADAMDIYTFDHVPNPAFPQTKRHWQVLNDSQRATLCAGLGCTGIGEAPPGREEATTCGDAGARSDAEAIADPIEAGLLPPDMMSEMAPAIEPSRLKEPASLLPAVGDAANSLAVQSSPSGGDRIRRSAGTARRGTPMNALKDAINRLYGLIAAGADAAEIAKVRKEVSQEVTLAVRAGEDVREDAVAIAKADEMIAGAKGPIAAVNGSETGRTQDEGCWGNDLTAGAAGRTAPPLTPSEKEAAVLQGSGSGSSAGMDEATIDFVKKLQAREQEKAAEDARKEAIQAACDAARATLGELPEEDKDYILQIVAQTARDAAEVPGAVAAQCDAFMKRLARERLKGAGYGGRAAGQVTTDPAAPGRATVQVSETHPVFDAVFDSMKGQAPAYLTGVARYLNGMDDHLRRSNVQGAVNPDNPAVRARRAYNLRKIVPMLDSYAQTHKQSKSAEEWFNRMDSLASADERALGDALTGGKAQDVVSDAVLVANLYNQPSVLMALIIQKLWDSKMLQFVQGIGSEEAVGGGGGWAMETRKGGIGKVLRIPVEFRDYANMSGYALQPTTNYDPGYLTPENTAVNEVRFGITYLTYSVQLRSVALQIGREAILGLAKGPAGIPAFARGMWHAAHDMGLRIDKGIADEMFQISAEYGAKTVTAQAQNYTNNSVYNAGGSITVNLNPTKRANAAVAAGDASMTYGANVVAAIRLTTAGNGSSSPYAGGATYITPVVRPRTNYDLTSAGLITSSVQNPFTVTQTGGSFTAPVMGWVDANGQIQNFASGAVANFAVDWNNGVLLFTNGYNAIVNNSGVCADAGGSTTTVSYSYETNFDDFLVNTSNYGTGISQEMYLNGLLTQIEKSAAKMATYPRSNPPDLCFGSPVASAWLTTAQKFWNWASPKDTELFPTPEYYASQNDINFARSSVPSQAADTRLLLTSNGTTKYGVDEPFTVRGPQFAMDSSGNPINREAALGYEYSVICTPQVQDQASPPNILNPVARTVILR